MNIGYIRIFKSGPSKEDQETALVAAGVTLDASISLYVDPIPKRGRQASFNERDEAIRALRSNDKLVIHSAPCLGSTETELQIAIAAISANGGILYDCSESTEIKFHPDAGKLQLWAKGVARKAREKQLEVARKKVAIRHAPPKALKGKNLINAKNIWETQRKAKISVKEIARQLDVSVSTLYREAKAGNWRMPE